VLHLVLAHRHGVGAVEQDVGGLQHRVGEHAHGHALLPRRLVLVLRLPLQLAERRDRVEDPGQLGMFGTSLCR
jgi:hypothetical protein